MTEVMSPAPEVHSGVCLVPWFAALYHKTGQRQAALGEAMT